MNGKTILRPVTYLLLTAGALTAASGAVAVVKYIQAQKAGTLTVAEGSDPIVLKVYLWICIIRVIAGALELAVGTMAMRDYDSLRRLKLYLKLGFLMVAVFVGMHVLNAMYFSWSVRSIAIDLILPVLFTLGAFLAVSQTPPDAPELTRPRREGLKSLMRGKP